MDTQSTTDYEIDFTDEDGNNYTYNIDYTITREDSGAFSVKLDKIRDENGEEIEDDSFMNDALTRTILEEHDYTQFDDDDLDDYPDDDEELDEVNDELTTDDDEAQAAEDAEQAENPEEPKPQV